MKRKNLFLLGSGLALWALAACTKELPYEEKLKDEVYSKHLVDDKAVHLFSSSMLNASRSSQDALPFSSGDNKRVQLEWTKDSLRVIELERDARFQGNNANNKLVLEIPVTHIDFQCSKDSYGECTNAEEERSDVTWNQKTKFKFKPEAAKSGALELLPILISQTLGENCYQEVSSKVVDVQIEESAMNMQIERTFKTNIDCLGNIDSLSDATVTAVYHYSIVKASSVLSADFKPVQYPAEDQGTFGFFATERTVLDADNNASESGRQVLMNHWNPNRSEIVYHLSDEFAKPENAMIKDLTQRTVQALNEGLQKSGAKFQITLKDPSGKTAGDIRHSMIVLVEDPVAANVIGYGPQTEDPATGEIISARTVMFLGTIKKFIGYTYDDIIREKRRAASGEKDSSGKEKAIALTPELSQKVAALKLRRPSLRERVAPRGRNFASVLDPRLKLQDLQKAEKDVKQYTQKRNDQYRGSAKAQFKYLQEAKNCAFGLNADIMGASISPRLAARFPADSKPWNELSDSEKENVMNVILPEIWVPTLIHELGHNLGLRHNFQGSEDKDNFYSQVELQALGIDHAVPFSTVMEYGDDLKALPVLGKYDIAALRYAYARKVELVDTTLIDVVGSLAEMKKSNAQAVAEAQKDKTEGEGKGQDVKLLALKTFGFCTDEHTGINAGCRRFDLGVTYTEIIQNEIQSYRERYESRNFRRGKAHMSLWDDPAYASSVSNRFFGMRIMQETYESLKHRFNLPDDSPYWNSDDYAFLKDIKQASLLAGQFLQSVIETPDVTCLIGTADKPNEISEVIPLAKLDASVLSCWDWQAPEGFVVIGQAGKSFRSKKDPNSDNAWADQIDVRGYWIDKLMASRILFSRQLGISTLDRYMDNFLDKSELTESLQASVQNIILNKVVAPQEVQLANGEIAVIELPVDTAETHIIDQSLSDGLARFFGLPNQAVSFSHVLARETSGSMVSANHAIDGKAFAEALKVIKRGAMDNPSIPAGAQSLAIGNEILIASQFNKVAFEAITLRKTAATLEQLPRQRLIDVYRAKSKGQGIETLPDVQKEELEVLQAVWAVDLKSLEDFLMGVMGSSRFYDDLVYGLPQ